MTLEQATSLLSLTQSLIDACMLVGGLLAANIFASTWRG